MHENEDVKYASRLPNQIAKVDEYDDAYTDTRLHRPMNQNR